jgi:hypothetical protein
MQKKCRRNTSYVCLKGAVLADMPRQVWQFVGEEAGFGGCRQLKSGNCPRVGRIMDSSGSVRALVRKGRSKDNLHLLNQLIVSCVFRTMVLH